jgi:hypothetical protein
MNIETQRAIGQEILAQLGGNKFRVMTGAKNFCALPEGGLFFNIGRFHGVKTTSVNITLNANDLYDMEFFSVRGVKLKVLALVKDLYFDQLQEVFTEQTGLYTSL